MPFDLRITDTKSRSKYINSFTKMTKLKLLHIYPEIKKIIYIVTRKSLRSRNDSLNLNLLEKKVID